MSMWTAIALIAIASIVAGIFSDKGKNATTRQSMQNSMRLTKNCDSLKATYVPV